jgi:hypothetical protein
MIIRSLLFTMVLMLLAAGQSVAGDVHVFQNSFSIEPADSADKPSEQPQDSACCDEPVIEGKVIVPGEVVDSIAAIKTRKEKKPWPTGALLRSLVIPGWGQVYNKKYIKAVLYGATEIYLIHYVRWRWNQMDEHQWNFQNTDDPEYKAEQFSLYEKSRDSRNLHLWLTGLVVLTSMFDAYVDAHLANFDEQDKAFEVYLAPERDRVQLSLVYNF